MGFELLFVVWFMNWCLVCLSWDLSCLVILCLGFVNWFVGFWCFEHWCLCDCWWLLRDSQYLGFRVLVGFGFVVSEFWVFRGLWFVGLGFVHC